MNELRKKLSDLLVSGDMNKFARDTQSYWRALARQLRRRWDCPSAVETSDIEQELLIGVMRSVEKYDPALGDAWTYIRWRSEREARRWMNRQRGALRLSDKAPSRYPLSESRVASSDPSAQKQLDARAEAGCAFAMPMQERVLSAKEEAQSILDDLDLDAREWVCGVLSECAIERPLPRSLRRLAREEHHGS